MSNSKLRRAGGELPWSYLGVSLVALALLACNGNDQPKPFPGSPTPSITTLTPADQSTGIAVNAKPSVVFDMAMAPLNGSDFTLTQGGTQVAGSVTNSMDGLTGTFSPALALLPGTVFTATITTGAMSSAGMAMAANRSWTFTTSPAAVPPTVISRSPAANATGVGIHAPVVAGFSKAMDPLTLTSSTFTLSQGGSILPGTIVNGAGNTSTLTPANPLTPSTVYSAALTTGVKDLLGNPLAGPVAWTFTTAAANTPAPTVVSTLPLANATGVALNASVAATFSQALDPLTLTSSTFVVKQGNTTVAGALALGSNGTTATFTPAAPLLASSNYGVTLTAGVKDLNGIALANPVAWTFTTGTTAAMGPAVVNLGTAGNYVILAETGISTVPGSVLTGDIGLSPAAATFITGFSLTADATNVFATSTQITGKAFAANYAVPTPTNLTTAIGDMGTAYTDAAGRPTPDHLNLGSGNIGGLTLAPGLYNWTSTVTIPTDVVINGGANDTWIFQTSGDLSMSGAKHITLSGGAQAKNIFWQVAGQVTIGTGAHFEGILLCQTQVTLQTLATMNGRILAQSMVALQQATVTKPQ